MSEFHDQVLIVTGGGAGIGRATALLFAADGARVAIFERNEAAGLETLRLIEAAGGRALFVPTDVGNAAGVRTAVDRVVAQWGRIDILFANAAIQIIRPVDEMTEDEWAAQIQINLGGTFLCTKYVVPVMRRQKSGCIVITSSGHAHQSYRGYAGYAASKGGQLAFMRAAAIDCAPDNIRVNCILPGGTETQMLMEHFENKPSDRVDLLAKIPLARLAQPDDIARAVRMLASRDAAYITGTALAVDGGLLAQG